MPRILAIESSCDETAVAVIEGRAVLANVIGSQADLHSKWGGVVPEMAARAHVEAFLPVLQTAYDEAGSDSFEAIAVTNRPGLVGSLSVGLVAAKALAWSRGVPLLGIHHLEGHLLSVLGCEREPDFPHASLLVSGGHTMLVIVIRAGEYEVIAETADDAAGEAFDKGGRLLGFDYPAGHAVQESAREGAIGPYELPSALPNDPARFSFSGLKSAIRRLVETEGEGLDVASAALALQSAIVCSLVPKTLAAAENRNLPAIALVGGVAANEALRHAMQQECDRAGMRFMTPPLELCTDNAAMIGLAAAHRFEAGESDDLTLDAHATAQLP